MYDLSNKTFSSTGRMTIEISGQVYTWDGGFGAILTSRERGVKRNSVRMICGIPFVAYRVDQGFFYEEPEVSWTISYHQLDADWIRDFRQKLFN
jgi:hypothetical protein